MQPGKYFCFCSLNTKLLFNNCAMSRSCSHSVCCSPDSSRHSGLCCQCDSLASQCLILCLCGPDFYCHTALRALGSMFSSLLVGAYDLFNTEENSCFELIIHLLFKPYGVKEAVLYLQPVIGTDGALLCVHGLNLKVVREVQRNGEARLNRDDVLAGYSMGGELGVSRTCKVTLWLIKYTTSAGHWETCKTQIAKSLTCSLSLFVGAILYLFI